MRMSQFLTLAVFVVALIVPHSPCLDWSRAADLLKAGPSVRALAFSPDGKFLAATSAEPEENGHATVWDLPSGKVLFAHQEPKGIPAAAFSPDGKWLVLGNFHEDALLVDTAAWKIDRKLPGHGAAARGVAFSHDGGTLAVGSYDGFIHLWDTATWTIRKTFKGAHENWVYAVVFSKDGKTLASSSSDNTAKLWDVETGKNLHTFRHGSIVRRILFTPDDRHVVNTSWDGSLVVRERHSGKLVLDMNRYGSPDDAAVSPDGKLLAAVISSEIRLLPISLDRPEPGLAKKVRELASGWDDDAIETRERATEAMVALGAPALAELKRIAAETSDPEVRLRARLARAAIREAKPLLKLRHAEGEVQSVAISPDGETIASGGPEGIVRLWNLSGKEMKLLRQFPAMKPRVPRGEY